MSTSISFFRVQLYSDGSVNTKREPDLMLHYCPLKEFVIVPSVGDKVIIRNSSFKVVGIAHKYQRGVGMDHDIIVNMHQ